MKVVVAVDSFKGSLSSLEAGTAGGLGFAFLSFLPGVELKSGIEIVLKAVELEKEPVRPKKFIPAKILAGVSELPGGEKAVLELMLKNCGYPQFFYAIGNSAEFPMA